MNYQEMPVAVLDSVSVERQAVSGRRPENVAWDLEQDAIRSRWAETTLETALKNGLVLGFIRNGAAYYLEPSVIEARKASFGIVEGDEMPETTQEDAAIVDYSAITIRPESRKQDDGETLAEMLD